MKGKSELKAALEGLQVAKPLRLPSSAPAFTPPTPTVQHQELATLAPEATPVAPQTVVPIQTQVAEDTLVVVETTAHPTTQAATSSPASTQTKVLNVTIENHAEEASSVVKDTRVLVKTPVLAENQASAQASAASDTRVVGETRTPHPTQVSRQTMVDAQAPVPSRTGVNEGTKVQPRGESSHAPEQDSAVVLEAQASPKFQVGYTRVPNSLLMRMVTGDLLRSEMQIALLIARLTISYQRRFSPISKAVIERQTGLRGPAVLQALSELINKGVIEKIPGNQHRPNQFGLTSAAEEFFAMPAGKVSGMAASDTLISPATQVPVTTSVVEQIPAVVSVATTAPVCEGTYFKDSERYKKKNSLSELPETLQKYFCELKPARKRESEWQAFESLRTDYRVEDISECLVLLQERGIKRGPNGEESLPCHSPMAYLAKAMGDIFGEVEARRQKAHKRIERERRDAEAIRELQEAEAREAAEWVIKERAFSEAIPKEGQQQEVIAKLLGNLPIRPDSQIGRRVGIGLWWDRKRGPEQILGSAALQKL